MFILLERTAQTHSYLSHANSKPVNTLNCTGLKSSFFISVIARACKLINLSALQNNNNNKHLKVIALSQFPPFRHAFYIKTFADASADLESTDPKGKVMTNDGKAVTQPTNSIKCNLHLNENSFCVIMFC